LPETTVIDLHFCRW